VIFFPLRPYIAVLSAVKRDPRHTFWAGHLIMMLEPRMFLQRQPVVRPDKGAPLNSIKEKQ
jgi:hypothetical protein